MPDAFDLSPLLAALSQAMAALPKVACDHPDAKVRRECHETVLLLTQARERVLVLQRMWGDRGMA